MSENLVSPDTSLDADRWTLKENWRISPNTPQGGPMELLQVWANVLSAIATLLIVLVAWKQLSSYRKEEIRNRTLDVCSKYDIDPVIAPIVNKIRKDKDLCEADAITLLNYFDVLAIGCKEGSYNWDIIFYQFKNIIPKQSLSIFSISKIDSEQLYPDLLGLINDMKSEIQSSIGVRKSHKFWH